MSSSQNFGETMAAWAAGERSVQGLALIGSRVRLTTDEVWRADEYSDWDFHIIASRPEIFFDAAWTRDLAGTETRAYAMRVARIGGVPKINAVFAGTEADFVVMSAGSLRLLRLLIAVGVHRHSRVLRRKLQDLAVVVRPGWKFLKDTGKWGSFYDRVVTDILDPRLTNEDVCRLADGFVCDYVSILRKIERGELLAAQRLLHRDLAEANFRLLHELRLRRTERTFPEARRVERVVTPQELDSITINTCVEGTALSAATEKSATACRDLIYALVGDIWRWPKVE